MSERRDVPSHIAGRSGYRELRRAVEETGGDVLETTVEGAADEEAIEQLRDISRQFAESVGAMRERLKRKRPGDPDAVADAAALEELSPIARTLRERVGMLAEFSRDLREGKSSDGKALDPVDREFRMLAIEETKEYLRSVFETIANLPAQSRIHDKAIRNQIGKMAAILGIVVAVGGGIKMGFDRGEEESGARIAIEKSEGDDLGQEYADEDAGEDKGGGASRRNHLDPMDAGESFLPDMAGEGEPGKFPEGDILGEVEYPWGSCIDEPLYRTNLFGRDGRGRWRAVAESVDVAGDETEATVRLRPQKIHAGKEIVLPLPLGFTVGEARTEPPVPFSLDRDRRVIIFEEGSEKNVAVTYTVVAAREKFHLPASEKPLPLVRSKTDERVIDALRDARSEQAPDILDGHLSEFLYVVSRDIQELVNQMPGTIEEKVGGIKAGDCDTLSAYAAGLVTDAGKPGMIAAGFLENDGAIEGARGHVETALLNAQGGVHLYETTAATSGRYVNVVLLDADRKRLETTVREMNAELKTNDTPQTRLWYYERFQIELRNILKQDSYDQYREKNASLEFILDFLHRLDDVLGRLEDVNVILPFLALGLTTILAGIGLGKGIEAACDKMQDQGEKIKHTHTGRIITWFQGMRGKRGDTPMGEKERQTRDTMMVRERIERIYKADPILETVFPLSDVVRMSDEEKRQYLRLLAVKPLFTDSPGYVMDLFANLRGSRQWKKVEARIAADGGSLNDLLHVVRDIMTQPKVVQYMEKQIPNTVAGIMAGGKKLVIEKIQPLERNGHVTTPKVLRALRVEEKKKPKEGMSRRPQAQRGGEFFDFQQYTPGTDAQLIDWKASARIDRPVVRRSVEQRAETSRSLKFDVMIDVLSAEWYELKKLASLLLTSQRHPNAVEVASVTFVAFGDVIDRLNEATMRKFRGGREPVRAVEQLIERIERLKLQHGFRGRKEERTHWHSTVGGAEKKLSRLLPLTIDPYKSYLMVGLLDISRPSEDIGQVFTFEQESERVDLIGGKK